MSGPRRFFWGNSLAQALVTAARHHGIPPEDLAYRVHEKRHGFVKHVRNVVIEVDPAAPRRAPGEATTVAPAREPAAESAASSGRGRLERQSAARSPRADRARAHGAQEAREVWSEPDEESLLAMAEAVRAVLALAGLDLSVAVRQGAGRVEAELTGAAVDDVKKRGLPLLEEMELLVPRAAHGLSGKMVRCRIDCGGLRGDREATLRDLARREAAEVAKTSEARLTELLSPADRRIIHLELADSVEVETESVGGGFEKRVRIAPRSAPD